MQTRSQRRFAIFFTLCEDMLQQRCEDWYDRIAMTKVLQCRHVSGGVARGGVAI